MTTATKPYLTAKETIDRMVRVRSAWSRSGSDSRRAALIARLNYACMEQDRLVFMGKIVFHGPQFSGRLPVRHS